MTHPADPVRGHPEVDCAQALDRLFEFLDGEVEAAGADEIRRHLAACEPCLHAYDVEDHLRQLIRRSCSETAPAELHVRIRQQLTILRAQVGDV